MIAGPLEELEAEYNKIVSVYLEFLVEVLRWRDSRNRVIETLSMPFGEFRPGQREMAVSVYRALAAESQVVLQAPTGIGKNHGKLVPCGQSTE